MNVRQGINLEKWKSIRRELRWWRKIVIFKDFLILLNKAKYGQVYYRNMILSPSGSFPSLHLSNRDSCGSFVRWIIHSFFSHKIRSSIVSMIETYKPNVSTGSSNRFSRSTEREPPSKLLNQKSMSPETSLLLIYSWITPTLTMMVNAAFPECLNNEMGKEDNKAGRSG